MCTLSGLPVLFAIAGAKADERQTLPGMLEAGRDVMEEHPGQTLLGDKNYFGKDFEAELTERHLALLRYRIRRQSNTACLINEYRLVA